MAAYVEVPIGAGGDAEAIVFEVRASDLGSGIDLVSDDGRALGRASRTLEASLGPIQLFMGAVVDRLRATEPTPDEVKVDVAVVFAGELGFVVAKGTAEASVTISATWSAPDRQS